jgi:hypothetical protein
MEVFIGNVKELSQHSPGRKKETWKPHSWQPDFARDLIIQDNTAVLTSWVGSILLQVLDTYFSVTHLLCSSPSLYLVLEETSDVPEKFMASMFRLQVINVHIYTYINLGEIRND